MLTVDELKLIMWIVIPIVLVVVVVGYIVFVRWGKNDLKRNRIKPSERS